MAIKFVIQFQFLDDSTCGPHFKLVFEGLETKTCYSENFAFLFQLAVPESHSILLDGSEYLGFTSESHVGVISFQYSLSNRAKFRSVPVMSTGLPHFPGIGYTYIFGALPLPATFSIGAIISTGVYNGGFPF